MTRFVPVHARGDKPVVPLPIDQAVVVVAHKCPMCLGAGVIDVPYDEASGMAKAAVKFVRTDTIPDRCPTCVDSPIPGAVFELSPLELFLAALIKPDAILPSDGSPG